MDTTIFLQQPELGQSSQNMWYCSMAEVPLHIAPHLLVFVYQCGSSLKAYVETKLMLMSRLLSVPNPSSPHPISMLTYSLPSLSHSFIFFTSPPLEDHINRVLIVTCYVPHPYHRADFQRQAEHSNTCIVNVQSVDHSDQRKPFVGSSGYLSGVNTCCLWTATKDCILSGCQDKNIRRLTQGNLPLFKNNMRIMDRMFALLLWCKRIIQSSDDDYLMNDVMPYSFRRVVWDLLHH